MSTDTDSNYAAMAGPLETTVKKDMKDQFFNEYDQWFVAPYCDDHRTDFAESHRIGKPWVMLPCCKKAKKFNSRTPGLFKEEFVGSGMVALNSKTYLCWKDDEDLVEDYGPAVPGVEDGREKERVKYSSKGVSKKTNSLTKEQYMSVLHTGASVAGVNTGFIKKNGKTFTYSQTKSALTYFYGKRKVAENGVDTDPIDL